MEVVAKLPTQEQRDSELKQVLKALGSFRRGETGVTLPTEWDGIYGKIATEFNELTAQTARAILTAHMDELHALALGLLEYETLSADEIRRLIRGERIVRDTSTGPSVDEPRPGRRSSVPPSGRPSGIGPEPEPQPGG